MIFLGLDYGRRRVGLAIAVESIVATRGWLDHGKGNKLLLTQIKEICQQEKVEKIVIGTVKGSMGKEIAGFVKDLTRVVKLPVVLIDETLTSWQAEKMVGWKDKGRVDSVAAALILERYLEGKKEELIK